MADYSLPEPGAEVEIGQRARRLRYLRSLTPAQLAAEASVNVDDVLALERGDAVSLAAVLAIHGILSSDAIGQSFFDQPRLTSIDEVEALERSRLSRL